MNRGTGMLMHDLESNHGEHRVGLFLDCRGMCTSMISCVDVVALKHSGCANL